MTEAWRRVLLDAANLLEREDTETPTYGFSVVERALPLVLAELRMRDYLDEVAADSVITTMRECARQ